MTALKRTYRLQIMLNAEALAILDAWRFEKRMPSRSDAVRELLNLVGRRLATMHIEARDRSILEFSIRQTKPPSHRAAC